MAKYVVSLTLPYDLKGYSVCTESHPTIDLVWGTFNSLFEHLKAERTAMESSVEEWK
jgi:hypothetical protein